MKIADDRALGLEHARDLHSHQAAGRAAACLVFLEPEHALGGLILAHRELGGCLPEGGVGGNRRVNRQDRLGDRVQRALEADLSPQYAGAIVEQYRGGRDVEAFEQILERRGGVSCMRRSRPAHRA